MLCTIQCVQVVAMNAACAMKAQECLHAAIAVISSCFEEWGVIFLVELCRTRYDPKLLHQQYSILSHYPGRGSLPMMFAIRKRLVPFLKSVKWKGRVGALHFFHKFENLRAEFNIYILGFHGGHGGYDC